MTPIPHELTNPPQRSFRGRPYSERHADRSPSRRLGFGKNTPCLTRKSRASPLAASSGSWGFALGPAVATGHGHLLGGAAPRLPLCLFARDSHGGILGGAPGHVKRKADGNPGEVLWSESLAKGRMREGWRNTDRVAEPRRGCAAGGRRHGWDWACGPQVRQPRLLRRSPESCGPGGCGRTQARALRGAGSPR